MSLFRLPRFLASLLLSLQAAATPSPLIEEERILHRLRDEIAAGRLQLQPARSPVHELRIALDAAEELKLAGKPVALERLLPAPGWKSLPAKEQARWFRLGGAVSEQELVAGLREEAWSAGLLYELLLLKPRLRSPEARRLLSELEGIFPAESRAFRARKRARFVAPAAEELRSLFLELPETSKFEGGSFAGKPRLFAFCRHDRSFPCLLALKDREDRPVRDGSLLWLQPALALSGYGKPFNERMGNTPSGVQLIRGVVPEASDPYSYGRFRRLILEFAPRSGGETEQKKLLPARSHASSWWQEASIARDMGRSELRIHGSGQRNSRPDISYFPFIATKGCVAQRELRYGDKDYIDQRLLLDRLMRAQGLSPVFTSEPLIRALFYVIDIDDRKQPVTRSDLARLGIE